MRPSKRSADKTYAEGWTKRGRKTLIHQPAPVSGKRAAQVELPDMGFMDLDAVLAVFPVGKSYWEEGVRTGK